MNPLGPEARDLLDAGRACDHPTAADRARVRSALRHTLAVAGTVGVVSAAAPAAATGAITATSTGWLGGVIWGTLLGLAVVGAGAALHVGEPDTTGPRAAPLPAVMSTPSRAHHEAVVTGTPPAEMPAAPTPTAKSDPQAPGAAPGAARLPAGDRASGAELVLVERPSEVSSVASATDSVAPLAPPPAPAALPAAPAVAVTTTPTAPPDPLVEETLRLGEAHRAIEAGEPARALALLDAQSAAYAGGQLREERAAARIFALCRLGRTAEARAAAASFLRGSPRSPLADRVRGACAPPVGR